MRIAIGQLGCDRDVAANRARARAVVTASEADLVVLPEYAQAFDPRRPAVELAERLDGPFVTDLQALAAGGPAVIAGMLEAAPGAPGAPGDAGSRTAGDHMAATGPADGARSRSPYNTVVAAGPAGLLGVYRKIHLYDRFGGREPEFIAPGDPHAEPLIVPVAGRRVGVLTCFDLRFAESAQRLADGGADVIVVPAAWAAGPLKVDHWTTLLRARAIEHRCWVAGVGMAGPGVIGHSLLIDPVGQVVEQAGPAPDDAAPVIVHEIAPSRA